MTTRPLRTTAVEEGALLATRAVVFPGQGSQRPGMAVPWSGHPGFERWEEASDALGWDVARLGTRADADELRTPRNCQIALFVHHAALLDAWRASGGVAAATAGHSLGEYNALVAAGVLSFADGLRLVDVRARATEAAAAQAPGGMVAVVGAEVGPLAEACAAAGVHVANDNAPGQVVVAGDEDRLAALEATLPQGSRSLPLEVGAAYHSPHMQSAVPVLGAALDEAVFAEAQIPVVANADATAHRDPGVWPDLLRRQVVSPVRWRESVLALAGMGVDEVVELGAAPVLTGLVKRIDRGLGRSHIGDPSGLEGMAA